jgi:transaldolase
MSRLAQLRHAGVSIWLDTLSRELLDTGELGQLIGECGVTGVTSNPTIFARAITGSDRYDGPLREAVAGRVRDPQELFFELALADVVRAADLLREAHEASHGHDGFASLQCTPDLAADTSGTVRQAIELWGRLRRPNVMIKVPATAAGIPAIEDLTALGINVNVTLLFSCARYDEVIEAHIAGLERRIAANQPIDRVMSVASFFVSRVDARADAALAPESPLRGRVAVANAQRAYALHRRRYAGARWGALRELGARPQRVLWASTETKNPEYSDVLYVEQLVAPDVVNTMTEATLRAFADHGEIGSALGAQSPAAEATLRDARAAGVDLDSITAELEREGVRSFCDAYQQLTARIESKLPPPPRSGTRPHAPGKIPA